jgi:N-acetylglucosamine kinase-like BadF-type ATPase
VRDAADLGRASDALEANLMASLGLSDPTALGRTLSNEGSAARIGRHVPAVFAAAEAGSFLAAKVIIEGGRELARLVGRLVRRGAEGGQVVAGGGVIARQPALMAAFQDGVLLEAPGWRVTLLTAPPVLGAIHLAERLLKGETIGHLPPPSSGGDRGYRRTG